MKRLNIDQFPYKLIHYSHQELSKTSLRFAPQTENPRTDKPHGLWLSVEDGEGWKEWCQAENFRCDDLSILNEIILKPEAKVLHLASTKDLDVFTLEFGETVETWFRVGIDWEAVSQLYHGIIIAPYQYTRRLHDATPWYYSWDCSSGCLWESMAIAEIRVSESERACQP